MKTMTKFAGNQPSAVMAGLVPAIHVYVARKCKRDVDARPKAGHDDLESVTL